MKTCVSEYVCISVWHTQLGKHCQELLMAVATNCTSHEADDLKVIESLLAIRLKTKLFSNQFVACIRYEQLAHNYLNVRVCVCVCVLLL